MKILLMATLLALLIPQAASAQPFEPRDDEAAFNAAAMEQAKLGNFDAAIVEAQKAVAVRGLNVFWLNLGRFQQRAGRCTDAMTSFSNAMTAPAVTNPDATIVRETAQKYVSELADECPAQVTVRCTPSDLRVIAHQAGSDDAPTPLPCEQPVSLDGGAWTFTGIYGSERVEEMQELRIARSYDIVLVIDVPVSEPDHTTPAPLTNTDIVARPDSPPQNRGRTTALLVGAGVVAATGLALDLGLATSRNRKLDGVDFLPVGLYLTSIGLAIAGWLW